MPKPEKIKKIEVISILISILALIASVGSIVLPQIISRFVISQITSIQVTNNVILGDKSDKLILPIVANNFGPYIRSIYKIDVVIDDGKGNQLPFSAQYIADSITEEMDKSNITIKRFSPIIVSPNSGVAQNIIFTYRKDYSNGRNWPELFKLQKGVVYFLYIRIFDSENGFLGSKDYYIAKEVNYAFEMKEEFSTEKSILTINDVGFKAN